MQPLKQLIADKRHKIECLFTDIDDTITTDGRLGADAYSAMARWQAAGKILIPITGRPAGWCDHIARMWPVDAVVGENGAFYFKYQAEQRKLQQRFLFDATTREHNCLKMQRVRTQILKQVPGCDVASDQNYREADLAIDFCEDVAPLDGDAVDHIVKIMRAAGMNAKISSIHVNGWFGDYDKLSMTKLLLKEQYQRDLEQQKDTHAFVGDSPNDAPMFAFFPLSFGVRNVEDCIDRIDHEPAFITRARAGQGFVELIDYLLS